MSSFSIEEWESRLKALPSQRHRIAFGAGISERLLPNYSAFRRETGYGSPSDLREALETAWGVVRGRSVTLERLRNLQARCRRAVPDVERFDSQLTSAAMDAANAIHETLEACYRDDPHRIAEVASFARDTIDLFVQERDNLDYADKNFEGMISRDPLMTRELEKQREELRALSQAQALDNKFVDYYRASASYGGKSNLDLI